jgi:hypothetical protein
VSTCGASLFVRVCFLAAFAEGLGEDAFGFRCWSFRVFFFEGPFLAVALAADSDRVDMTLFS